MGLQNLAFGVGCLIGFGFGFALGRQALREQLIRVLRRRMGCDRLAAEAVYVKSFEMEFREARRKAPINELLVKGRGLKFVLGDDPANWVWLGNAPSPLDLTHENYKVDMADGRVVVYDVRQFMDFMNGKRIGRPLADGRSMVEALIGRRVVGVYERRKKSPGHAEPAARVSSPFRKGDFGRGLGDAGNCETNT